MAGDKTSHALKGKKARKSSTSGIFKKHRGNTPVKDSRKRLNGPPFFLRPRKRKPKPKPEHPLSVEFSSVWNDLLGKSNTEIVMLGAVENSRKCIEKMNTLQLNSARDGLIVQAQGIVQHAQDRIREGDNSNNSLRRPLSDEVLELTQKNGTVITTTLGKRMNAYRELVKREEKRLEGLFEKHAEVSSEIENFALDCFGSTSSELILKNSAAETLKFDNTDQRELAAALEAEKERVQKAADAVGEKAIEAMRANEKVCRFMTFQINIALATNLTIVTGIEIGGSKTLATTLREHVC